MFRKTICGSSFQVIGRLSVDVTRTSMRDSTLM